MAMRKKVNDGKANQDKAMLCDEYRPGMEGLIAARSSICYIDGYKGIVEYRGINISELVENSSFEETTYLLLYGQLPNLREFRQFKTLMSKQRYLPRSVLDAIAGFPVGMHPIHALQSSISLLQGEDFYADDVGFFKHNIMRSISLVSKVPTIIAAFDRHRNNEEPIPPISKYTHAENFLFMLTGEPPKKKLSQVFDKCLILHAEHTLNPSTLATRVIASTNASIYSAVSGAVGSLSGPLHGGANEQVLLTLQSIGSPENVDTYLREHLDSGAKIPGFGHRVYRTKDPRAILLQKELEKILSKGRGAEDQILARIASKLEEAAKAELGPKGIYPNVDYYSGMLFKILGIPLDLFIAVFAMARVTGWTSHWMEQITHNRVFRPTQDYIGDHKRPYIPIKER
jgi:citrate synthase